MPCKHLSNVETLNVLLGALLKALLEICKSRSLITSPSYLCQSTSPRPRHVIQISNSLTYIPRAISCRLVPSCATTTGNMHCTEYRDLQRDFPCVPSPIVGMKSSPNSTRERRFLTRAHSISLENWPTLIFQEVIQ